MDAVLESASDFVELLCVALLVVKLVDDVEFMDCLGDDLSVFKSLAVVLSIVVAALDDAISYFF